MIQLPPARTPRRPELPFEFAIASERPRPGRNSPPGTTRGNADGRPRVNETGQGSGKSNLGRGRSRAGLSRAPADRGARTALTARNALSSPLCCGSKHGSSKLNHREAAETDILPARI